MAAKAHGNHLSPSASSPNTSHTPGRGSAPARAIEPACAGGHASPIDGEGPDVDLVGLAEHLSDSIIAEARTRHLGDSRLPTRDEVQEMVELVRQIVFPGFFGKQGLTPASLPAHVAALVAQVRTLAEDQIRRALRYCTDIGASQPLGAADVPESERQAQCERAARSTSAALLRALPTLRARLALDVQAAYDGDPAATHIDETIICYPGVDAIFSHRLAHEFYTLGVPMLPRMIGEMAHGRTGIDIHPGASIGESFFIDHGGGVVIGETSVIGRQVRIYQGVTLGAKSFAKDAHGRLIKGLRRHPSIGDRVTIYAGAVILGGDTHIGDDCIIGGGVFVTTSVPPGHMVRQKQPELQVRAQQADAAMPSEFIEDWVI